MQFKSIRNSLCRWTCLRRRGWRRLPTIYSGLDTNVARCCCCCSLQLVLGSTKQTRAYNTTHILLIKVIWTSTNEIVTCDTITITQCLQNKTNLHVHNNNQKRDASYWLTAFGYRSWILAVNTVTFVSDWQLSGAVMWHVLLSSDKHLLKAPRNYL